MELLKLLSANEIVAQALSFLLLLLVLRFALWKRFLGILDKRKEKISSEFKRIEDAKAEVEKLKAEYAGRLGAIEETSRARIQEAIHEGRRVADEIRENAAKDGEKLVQSARETIKSEVGKAKEELKNTMVDLVIDVSEKVVQEKLSEEQDRKMVEYFLKEVVVRK